MNWLVLGNVRYKRIKCGWVRRNGEMKAMYAWVYVEADPADDCPVCDYDTIRYAEAEDGRHYPV